jgi:glycerol-3-phosphate dehydrogenase
MGTASKKAHTKGGGMIRTVHGNLLVGPDAEETFEKEDFATNRESVEATFAKFKASCPDLSQSQIITSFAGIRAPTYGEDFVVCKGRRTVNLVHAAGIQSPGLTAAPAIAVDAARFTAELLNEAYCDAAGNGKKACGRTVMANEHFNPVRKSIPHTAVLNEEERQTLIRKNPDYGVIVCRCEEVSKGEILDSLRRSVPCDTVDGVKRRVRPGMGRCQGGFCGPLIVQLIAEEKGLSVSEVTKRGPGSEILCGSTKGNPL